MCFCLIIWSDDITTSMRFNSKMKMLGVNIKRAKISHTMGIPVVIDSDSDFATKADVYGWTGNGTQGNPYVIQDMVIVTNLTGTNAITIRHTDVYFVIRNCTVTATDGDGIFFDNVSNGVLDNNTAQNNIVGYHLSSSSIFNTMTNNIAQNNKQYGFWLDYSGINNLINNTAQKNGNNGFYLEYSSTNILNNNTAYRNGNGFLLYQANANLLTNNTAQINAVGIKLFYSSNLNTLVKNTVQNSGKYGFELWRSSSNTLTNNSIQYSDEFGMFLWRSDSNSNTIKFNDFYLNCQNFGGAQAYSVSSTNLFDYNYWSDKTSPDVNLDGIVDTPYNIGGSVCSDVHPVSKSYLLYLSTNPQNLQATAGDSRVTLNWIAPISDGGSPITYKIYRTSNSGINYTFIGMTNSTTFSDTGLTNGVRYHYVVSAVNSVGESDNSNEVDCIPAAVPSVPRNLQATADDIHVTLTWTIPISDGGSRIIMYKIYRSNSSGTGYQSIVGISSTTFTDRGVTNGVTYYYIVSAVNKAGESENTTEVSATIPAVVPSAPQNLQATAGGNQVTLSWTAPIRDGGSPITMYEISRSTSSGRGYMYIGTTFTTNFTDSGLTIGVSYYYVVNAVNSVGKGPNSNEVSVILKIHTTTTSSTHTTTTTTILATTEQATSNWQLLVTGIIALTLVSWLAIKRR